MMGDGTAAAYVASIRESGTESSSFVVVILRAM